MIPFLQEIFPKFLEARGRTGARPSSQAHSTGRMHRSELTVELNYKHFFFSILI